MPARIVVFLVRLGLSLLCGVVPAFLFIKNTFERTTLSLLQTNAVMIPILLYIALAVNAAYRLTNKWAQQMTGEPPEPETKPEIQAMATAAMSFFFAGAAALAWYAFVPERTTPLNTSLSALTFGLALILLMLSFNFKAFERQYIGLAIGCGISGILFSSPSSEDFPALLFIMVLTIPPTLGHLANTWWNKQGFVKEARSRKDAKELQRQQEDRSQEQRRQQTQREAEQNAALKAKLNELNEAAFSPSSAARSPEAQRVAEEVKNFWKK